MALQTPLYNYVITTQRREIIIMLTLFITKSLITLLAVLHLWGVIFLLLMFHDKRQPNSFKENMKIVAKSPIALSLYLSVRFASVLLSVGFIVCLVFLI